MGKKLEATTEVVTLRFETVLGVCVNSFEHSISERSIDRSVPTFVSPRAPVLLDDAAQAAM